MTDDEKLYSERIHSALVKQDKSSLPSSVPVIDVAVCHEMGLSESQVVDAMLGKNRSVLSRKMDEMRLRGEIE